MISMIFLKLKCPSFGNICLPRNNLTCIVVAVDSRCVWGCVRLGAAGGSQYTTSCEPLCGLAVLLGRLVPHQSLEFVISNITQSFHTYMFWPHPVDGCPTRHLILACDAFCGLARSSSITLTNSWQ